MNDKYDVVVVGTGVAGALMAWKLAQANCKVVMIEAGEKHLEKGDRAAFVKTFAEAPQSRKTPSQPYVDPDNSKFAHSPDVADFKVAKDAQPGEKLYYMQLGPNLFLSQYQRLVGGSTWAWRGNSPRFIPNDFKLRTKHGRGVDWPISYKDLESWYCDAEDALGVAGNHREWNNLFGAFRSRAFPMANIVQSFGDEQLKKALRGAVIEGQRVEILSLPQARNSKNYDDRPACHGNSNCLPLCPIGAKYDASVHVKKAIKLGAALIDRAVVTEFKLDGRENVSEVSYKTWDGVSHSVTGKIVVLAAHAIESTKLLLLSNGGAGIANTSGQVGRNLMDHLGGEGAALMPFPVYPYRGPQSTSCIEAFRDHKFRDKFCAFRFTIGNDGWGRSKHAFGVLKDLTDRKLFGQELRDELFGVVSRQLRIAYSTEQLPDPGNRVTLSSEQDDFGIRKPQIAFKVDDYSREGMAYAQTIIKQIFKRIGAPEQSWEFTDLNGGRFFSGSAHIMGTCRMGIDPNSSVVDSDCRSHDHKNLFIAGSSVFPTGSTTNPTITIAALALRAAETIKKRLRTGG